MYRQGTTLIVALAFLLGTGLAASMKEVSWADHGITFQVPEGWEQVRLDSKVVSFRHNAGLDSMSVSAQISPVANEQFPAQASLEETRNRCRQQQENGQIAACEDYAIGDVPGLVVVDVEQEDPQSVRRLTWVGFQQKDGWNQVIITLAAFSERFPQHEETLREILSSFEIQTV